MTTVVGSEGSTEETLLREALDRRGFTAGADPYVIHLHDDRSASGPTRWPPTPVRRTLIVSCAVDRRWRDSWDLLARGFDDVITWTGPETVDVILSRVERWREVDRILSTGAAATSVHGRSPAFLQALSDLVELAVYGSGAILLVGETGTGKEVAARLAQAVAGGDASRFVVVDCTTIVPSLSGSELFGHERGAFTGAERARAGAFAAADGGTLFLDEIGELPLTLQAELLRVLQEGTYKRVGGDAWSRTRFRLVSATNRDLEAEQRAGRFRSDLYHRIASGVVRLPSLRERADDLELLFGEFLSEAAGRHLGVAPSVVAMLQERTFPGNLRELRQLAYAVAARHAGPGPVTPGDVPPRYRPETTVEVPPEPVRSCVEQAVRACLKEGLTLPDLKALVGDVAVEAALTDCAGSARRAAALLGVTERAVQLRKRTATASLSGAQR